MTNPDVVHARLKTVSGKRRKYTWILWLLFAMASFFSMALIGAAGGYQAAQVNWGSTQSAFAVQSIAEQYTLGLEDIKNEQYDLAKQRFEYILAQDPAFPGAGDRLAEVMAVLYATATPTLVPPTQTPTPTRDLRPVEELFANVLSKFALSDWNGTIDAIVALRQTDPNYRVVEVDGILYRSLRNRGIDKIKQESNLEGGIYDLALVEQIGPLDAEALTYRDLARYYMMGSGFWEVYPEQAVYYFGLVASAAPYLRDASGWTAAARYQAALVQYADQLARDGDWCSAQEQYELAISYGGIGGIQETVTYAANQCAPPTETPSPITETPTFTISPSPTFGIPISPTPSLTPQISPTTAPSWTPTITSPATQAPTATQELTPTTIPSLSPTPSPTTEPTQLPTSTNTPDLLPTETATLTSFPSETPDLTTTPSGANIPVSPTP